MTWWNLMAGLLGGIGLFLLGIRLMTDGLRHAAGPAMSTILDRYTRTRLRALISGLLVTSVVQSSSAVVVAAIGFVNAGILTLTQALWVLFGANVGTTVTGWLVAVVGMQFKIEILTLPLIGIGMILRLTDEHGRRGSIGVALAGLGALFVGIGVLRDSFSTLATSVTLPQGDSLFTIGAQVAIGVVMTVLMQSSNAAMVITLTAAQGGLISLLGAAAVVIGAHIGTSAKAILVGIGATPNAKRAAAGHVLFNLATGAIGIMLLPWLVPTISATWESLGLGASPAPQVALFHTLLSVVGVIIMWPLSRRLIRFLQKRFRSKGEDAAEPRYLDATVLAVPALALDALHQEVRRSGTRTIKLFERMLQHSETPSFAALQSLEHLNNTIGDFVTHLHSSRMAPETASRLPDILRVVRYYDTVTDLMVDAAAAETEWQTATDLQDPAQAKYGDDLFRSAAMELLEFVIPDRVPLDDTAVSRALDNMANAYQTLKASHLAAGARGELQLVVMDARLRYFSALRRACEQAVKAEQLLRDTDTGMLPPPAKTEE